MDAVRLGSLLSSRLCHDVIGPASAVVNGLELVEAEGGLDTEAMAMITSSATQISHRLQFYRAAYGVAAGLGFIEARRIATAYFEGGKIALDWPEAALPNPSRDGAAKLALNMLLLGADLLGRGGRLALGASAAQLAVGARGEMTRLEELALVGADALDAGAITPRTVQPYFVTRLAASIGARFHVVEAGPGGVDLAATF